MQKRGPEMRRDDARVRASLSRAAGRQLGSRSTSSNALAEQGTLMIAHTFYSVKRHTDGRHKKDCDGVKRELRELLAAIMFVVLQ